MNEVEMLIQVSGDLRRYIVDSANDGFFQALEDVLRALARQEEIETEDDEAAAADGYIRRHPYNDLIIIGGTTDFKDDQEGYWVISDPNDHIDIVRGTYPLCNIGGESISDTRPGGELSKLIILNPHICQDNLVLWTVFDYAANEWVVYNADVNSNELTYLLNQIEKVRTTM